MLFTNYLADMPRLEVKLDEENHDSHGKQDDDHATTAAVQRQADCENPLMTEYAYDLNPVQHTSPTPSVSRATALFLQGRWPRIGESGSREAGSRQSAISILLLLEELEEKFPELTPAVLQQRSDP